jgi:hypothetical protein
MKCTTIEEDHMTRRHRELIFPHATSPTSYRDVTGNEVVFDPVIDDDPERDCALFLAVAQSTLANFSKIWNAMTLIVDDRKSNVRRLWAEKIAEARRDADLLKLPLPVEEAFAIWQRSCAGLRLVAENDPNLSRRQELLDVVAESERRMAERMELHVRKYEERKKGDAA